MKVIFAQGNPGNQYASSRHNTGFIILDHLANEWNVEFTKKPKFYADIAEAAIGSEKVLLVKPTTFYNETGQSARAILDFYKLDPATDFVVIHDDLALPLGTIRTRQKGSDAGNNGVKSLNAHLGTNYARIRVGIYTDDSARIPAVNFVLGIFTVHEKNALSEISHQAERFVNDFISNKFVSTKVVVSGE